MIATPGSARGNANGAKLGDTRRTALAVLVIALIPIVSVPQRSSATSERVLVEVFPGNYGEGTLEVDLAVRHPMLVIFDDGRVVSADRSIGGRWHAHLHRIARAEAAEFRTDLLALGVVSSGHREIGFAYADLGYHAIISIGSGETYVGGREGQTVVKLLDNFRRQLSSPSPIPAGLVHTHVLYVAAGQSRNAMTDSVAIGESQKTFCFPVSARRADRIRARLIRNFDDEGWPDREFTFFVGRHRVDDLDIAVSYGRPPLAISGCRRVRSQPVRVLIGPAPKPRD